MTPSDTPTIPQHDDLDGVAPPAARQGFVGHGAAWQELTEAYAGGRMHHAWLLQGEAGIGKATVAFAMARHILGAGQDGQAVARQIAGGGHPGLLHLARPPVERGTGFRTQITVDEIRRLTHFFQTTAGLGWRIAIIDPADDMNRSAANALLKMLEEPPARSLFLITNHRPGRILPTIRSRCRVLRFAELTPDEIARQLAEDVPDSTQDARQAAAASAGGSLRTALQHLMSGGLEVSETTRRLVAMPAPDWTAIMALGDAVTLKGREAAYTLMAQAAFRAVADEAQALAMAGDLVRAERLAAFWQAEDARWREAEAFNLDRKQVLLTFFNGLAEARADSAAFH
ncbi:DNA polymerase III subunit delta' [Aureimonas frigidaquae]|nr:DNA polymerase III subunit delta' [Aureimonas frigidaquae]